ncbi:MAG: AarF/ABC1/UbiB kinase family protein [Chthoniobacterales bacterium]
MIFNTIKSAVDFYAHIPRYREIFHILFKYGLADVLKLVALQKFLKIEDAQLPIRKSEILNKPLPERFRLSLEELGPTFVKFGQILSSRRDLITDEYFEQLSRLQDEVPPFPSKDARKIIEHELNKPLDEIFAVFEDEPIGAASMAQVHKALLKDGTTVAVKVQRPDIEKTIELDIAILVDLAKFVEKHVPESGGLNPVGVVEEFSKTLMKELDFNNEAQNVERFTRQFEDNPDIKAPLVFREASSPRVLTMEFITGWRIDDVDLLRKKKVDTVELAEKITNLIYMQVFDFGFFHGDPHPGNMTVLPGGVIGLYDFGMMGDFTPEFRESVALMIAGLAEKDHQQTMRSILEMSDEGIADNQQQMLADVEKFSNEHLNQPLKDINLGFVLNQLLELLRNNQLRMKASFYLGIKALAQVEAIGRSLDPDLNFIILGEPYAKKVIQDKYSPKQVFQLLRHLFGETVDFLKVFPHDFRTFYEGFKRGRYSIPMEHKFDPEGFEPLRKTLDSVANRLTNAILSASVLICSSIIVLSHIPPRFHDISIFGAVGVCFGMFMCVRLVFSIWKHGGL